MSDTDFSDPEVVEVAKIDNLERDCCFIAKKNGKIWKDDHPTGAVDAAYYGEDKYDMAILVDDDFDLDFYEVEIVGSFTSRLKGSVDTFLGDSPGESVRHIDFPKVQSIDHCLTDSNTIEGQIIDILEENGATHYVDILDNYMVDCELNRSKPDYDGLKSILEEMSENTRVYVPSGRTRTWWDIK